MLNKLNYNVAKLAFPEEAEVSQELKGILVSPTRTIATDGSVAIIVSSFENNQVSLFDNAEGVEPADYWTEFILPRETALKVAKSIPKPKKGIPQAQYPIVDATTENNTRAMVSVNDRKRQDIVRVEKIDGEFPDVDKLIPNQTKAKATFLIDAEGLLKLAQQLAEFAHFHANGSLVEVAYHGGGKPLRFDLRAEFQSITAILMARGTGDEA